jgi:hypothetical protein
MIIIIVMGPQRCCLCRTDDFFPFALILVGEMG